MSNRDAKAVQTAPPCDTDGRHSRRAQRLARGDATRCNMKSVIPVAASMMPRHQLSAALYARLRVVLFERERGRAVF